jgi:hypothetical protein
MARGTSGREHRYVLRRLDRDSGRRTRCRRLPVVGPRGRTRDARTGECCREQNDEAHTTLHRQKSGRGLASTVAQRACRPVAAPDIPPAIAKSNSTDGKAPGLEPPHRSDS